MRTSTRGALRRLATSAVAVLAALAAVTGTAAAAFADNGVDISSWQHGTSLNWSAVKADGVSFAFIKATEGSGYVNPYFASDWSTTRSVGLFHGAYHFARPSIGSAVAQARYFVAHAGTSAGKGDLPPVLDLEATGGLKVTALRNWTANWLETVQQLTGRTPMIYVSPYFWQTYLGNSTAFTRYPLWIAHYGVSAPTVPGGWTSWTFWQKTSSATVNGIGGRVDMNTFHGTRAQLAALANSGSGGTPGTGTPTGPTAPTTPTTPTTPTDPGTTDPATTDPGTTDPGTTDPGTTDPGTDREPVARSVSALTLSLSRAKVFSGRAVTLSGALTDAEGQPMPGRKVKVFRRDPGTSSWTRIAVLPTGDGGSYSLRVQADSPAELMTRWRGGRFFLPSTTPVQTLSIRPRRSTQVEINAGRNNVRPGHRVKLYGHLTTAAGRALAHRRVAVYQHVPGHRGWTFVERVRSIAPTGWWQVYVRPDSRTVYKTVYGGAVRFAPSTSTRLRVDVR